MAICQFFSDSRNTEAIERFRQAGLSFEQTQSQAQKVSDLLEGKRFVISGTFTRSREEVKNLITAHGGKVLASVSGNTDYFLTGEKVGPSKMKKATELNVLIINENDFMSLIERPQTLF